MGPVQTLSVLLSPNSQLFASYLPSVMMNIMINASKQKIQELNESDSATIFFIMVETKDDIIEMLIITESPKANASLLIIVIMHLTSFSSLAAPLCCSR